MSTPSERIFIDGRYWLLGSSVDDTETLTLQYYGSESKSEFYRLDPNQEPSSKVKAMKWFDHQSQRELLSVRNNATLTELFDAYHAQKAELEKWEKAARDREVILVDVEKKVAELIELQAKPDAPSDGWEDMEGNGSDQMLAECDLDKTCEYKVVWRRKKAEPMPEILPGDTVFNGSYSIHVTAVEEEKNIVWGYYLFARDTQHADFQKDSVNSIYRKGKLIWEKK